MARPQIQPSNPIKTPFGDVFKLELNIADVLKRDLHKGNGTLQKRGIKGDLSPIEVLSGHPDLMCPSKDITVYIWTETHQAQFTELGEQLGERSVERPGVCRITVVHSGEDKHKAYREVRLLEAFIRDSVLTSSDMRGYLVGTMSTISWTFSVDVIKTEDKGVCRAVRSDAEIIIRNYSTAEGRTRR